TSVPCRRDRRPGRRRRRRTRAARARGASQREGGARRLDWRGDAGRSHQRQPGPGRPARAAGGRAVEGAGGMTLGTNFATRPFSNERTVRLLLALTALVLLALTAFTITRLISLTRRDQALGEQMAAAETRTRELRRDVARLRSGIDAKHVADMSAATHEANLAIDQRAFSWTELFNRLEATLPANVRLSAVRPVVDEEGRLTV